MINKLKEQIAQLIHIEDVIGYYTSLSRGSKSGRTLECHCPFHPDKHRSLKIRKSDQAYECTICGEMGNMYSFIQLMEGCEQLEALNILIDRYQIPIKKNELNSLCKPEKEEENILSRKTNLFSTIYLMREYNMVLNSLDPLFSDKAELNEIFCKFEICLTLDILPDTYHNLREKKVMPVRNEFGEIISFLAFKIDEEDSKTCLCIPAQSEGYFLFGLYQALDSMQSMGFVYLMDNYRDVLLMHVAGFCNTVAYEGETITKHQIAILQRYTKRIVLLHNEEMPTHVKCFKITAKLLHAGIETTHVCYKASDLESLFVRMKKDKFYCFIHQNTRYNRLVTYKVQIANKIEMRQIELESAATITERAKLRSQLIPLKQKLMKVSGILELFFQYRLIK